MRGIARSTRTHDRVALVVVCVVLLFVAVLVPFAIGSVVTDIVSPQSHHEQVLTPTGAPAESATYVNVDLVSLDEWQGTVTLRVTGEHQCKGSCTWNDSVLFVSIPDHYAGAQGLPPAHEVVFPSKNAQAINETFQLPVYGEPVRYPYDEYRFSLGILVRHVGDDGSDIAFDPNQLPGQQLFVSARMQAPRLLVSTPKPLTPQQIMTQGAGLPYFLTASMTFSRPVYLQVLALLLVLLVTAATAYAVFLRPLDEIVINSGALVLGVWGIRAILLGTNVPGFTAVDLALSVVILFLLVAMTIRTLFYLWKRVRSGRKGT